MTQNFPLNRSGKIDRLALKMIYSNNTNAPVECRSDCVLTGNCSMKTNIVLTMALNFQQTQYLESIEGMKPSLPLSDISPSFSVTDNSGTEIGVGRPLTALDLENTDLINTLTRARAKNQGMFLTQFEASFGERGNGWLIKLKPMMKYFLIERKIL